MFKFILIVLLAVLISGVYKFYAEQSMRREQMSATSILSAPAQETYKSIKESLY